MSLIEVESGEYVLDFDLLLDELTSLFPAV